MDSHIDTVCKSAYFYLYNIRKNRKNLDRKTAECVIHAFISSCLDYCNALLFGISKSSLQKLQRVQNAAARLLQNAAARLLNNVWKYEHISRFFFSYTCFLWPNVQNIKFYL